MTAEDPPAISAMGEAALLLQAAGPMSEARQTRVLDLAGAAAGWPGVRELVPGVNNLLLLFDPAVLPPAEAEERLRLGWAAARTTTAAARTLEIPVFYGGERGEDLEDVAARTGLGVAEVIRRHSEALYTVLAIGAVPGLPYLAGLHPSLASPRRDVPRTRVEGGSVIIGGQQAGVLPVTTPSGWHILGWTPMMFFDPAAVPPVVLSPGDRVRFVVAGAPA